MRSPRCAKLIGVLSLAVVIVGGVSCGGKASEQHSVASGGAGGGASSAGAAGVDRPPTDLPEPSTVSVNGAEGGTDPDATPHCIPDFQGFSARVAAMTLELEAFALQPGDYEGDPVHILWLDAVRADGEHFRAVVGSADSRGSISLHVKQVEPRFRGSLEALLPDVDDPTRNPLKLSLTFDIARDACP